MGGVVSALPVIGTFIATVGGLFQRRPSQPCPIDNGIMAEMQRLRNEQQQRQAQLDTLTNQLQEQARNNQAQAQALANREQELRSEQNRIQADLQRIAQQDQELVRRERDQLQEQARNNLAQSQALANREQELRSEQSRIQDDLQRIAQQDQESTRRADETKLAQAKIDAQREERHRERDPKKLAWLRQQAKKTLGLDFVNAYNICVTGESGTGKSTTINGFCDVDERDPNAAKVDVNECTDGIKKYKHPKLNHLYIWDCPGAGTERHPAETYFYDKFLFGFDYLLFVCCTRIRQIDIDLMKQAIAHKVPFALVRNKANHDLEAKRRKPGFESMPQREILSVLIEEHHRFMRDELERAGIAATDMPPFFVINAWALTREREVCFEEAQLIEHVLKTVHDRRN